MDARKISVLLTVLETGSLIRSAEELGYTPSGLTYMMNALETELGLKIIERGRFGVRLTPEGEELLPYLRECVNCEDNLRGKIQLMTERKLDMLRIGIYDTLARNWLPPLLNRFQEEYGPLNVTILADNLFRLYAALENDTFDLLLAARYGKNNYKFTPLLNDHFRAVFPPDFDNKGRDFFPLADFEGVPFLMPSFGVNYHVQELLKKHGVTPNILPIKADDPVVIDMVSNGMGASILSDYMLMGQQNRAQVWPLRPEEYRTLGIVYKERSRLPAVARQFVSFLKKTATRL